MTNDVWAVWRKVHHLDGVTEPAWYDFIERVAETLDIGPGTRVFEVGSGSGAFLSPFAENGYEVGGLERSPDLAAMARRAIPTGSWGVGEPSDLDPGQPWEVVIAFGLFDSFPDLNYARGVLARMVAKATHAIAVLDVLDVDDEGNLPGSSGLRYDRGWMLHELAEIGASAVQVEDQRIDGDTRTGQRFNVYVRV